MGVRRVPARNAERRHRAIHPRRERSVIIDVHRHLVIKGTVQAPGYIQAASKSAA